MDLTEGKFFGDLQEATASFGRSIPDLMNALDAVTPHAMLGDLRATRRFTTYYLLVADELGAVVAEIKRTMPAGVVEAVLRREIYLVPLEAPSPDGYGVVLMMVNIARSLAGAPREHLDWNLDNPAGFKRFSRVADQVLLERDSSHPLEHAMKILGLTATDMGEILDVSRQAVEKWMLSGVPADRSARILTIDEIATVLHQHLRRGAVPGVARKKADAFEGSTLLEALAGGHEQAILDRVKDSFDYGSVA
ncbi:MAG: hypothetical protein ACRENX_09000 [Candidatus Dormibacteria bacterium]